MHVPPRQLSPTMQEAVECAQGVPSGKLEVTQAPVASHVPSVWQPSPAVHFVPAASFTSTQEPLFGSQAEILHGGEIQAFVGDSGGLAAIADVSHDCDVASLESRAQSYAG